MVLYSKSRASRAEGPPVLTCAEVWMFAKEAQVGYDIVPVASAPQIVVAISAMYQAVPTEWSKGQKSGSREGESCNDVKDIRAQRLAKQKRKKKKKKKNSVGRLALFTNYARPCRRPASTESIPSANTLKQDFLSSLHETTAIAHDVDASPIQDPRTQQEIAETEAQSKLNARNTFRHIRNTTGYYGSEVQPHYTPQSLLINPPRASEVTLELLLASQAHFGHSTSLWNPSNSGYIFGIRSGIHIISLETTLIHLRRAARVVSGVAERGGIILFVGTRKDHDRYIVRAAQLAGAYHLFETWTPGGITNKDQILGRCSTQVVDEFDRPVRGFEEQMVEHLPLTPDLVVCMNPLENYVLLAECGMKGIPTIGVIDTDADPTWVTYSIPANDDSLRSIGVIAGALGRAGEEGRGKRIQAATAGIAHHGRPSNLRLPTKEEVDRSGIGSSNKVPTLAEQRDIAKANNPNVDLRAIMREMATGDSETPSSADTVTHTQRHQQQPQQTQDQEEVELKSSELPETKEEAVDQTPGLESAPEVDELAQEADLDPRPQGSPAPNAKRRAKTDDSLAGEGPAGHSGRRSAIVRDVATFMSLATRTFRAAWRASSFRQTCGRSPLSPSYAGSSHYFESRRGTVRPLKTSTSTSSHGHPSNRHEEEPKIPGGRKTARSPSAKNSLRSVAVEAERSREGLGRGGRRRGAGVEEDAAKNVTAYCAAEQYRMPEVSQTLKSLGYTIDPHGTGLYPQVLHVRYPPAALDELQGSSNRGQEPQRQGDIFVFPSGTVVTWNVDELDGHHLVTRQLLEASENAHTARIETEDLEYIEETASERSSVHGDTIRLGVKPPSSGGSTYDDSSQQQGQQQQQQQKGGGHPLPQAAKHADTTNLTLAKIAFSSGLARSTKLAVLESALSTYFRSTHSIPVQLSRFQRRLPYSRRFILRKTGELLTLRAQLNLYSELTDSLPDLFWDSRHELGLEGYFEQVGRALDVNVRIRVLNERMNYAQEIATVLRETLAEKHGLLLEWAIIGLILVEVVFEVLRHVKERGERGDPMSTENLMRRHLEEGRRS
ncbi:MAG: hypothetical protein M1828_002677 [Chrysothrix sp. TS-e1954]|nr:MAG: hypothetical protein M1828_002677 [Chrysothrix sp. TS-e1954]